ncbi:2-dehydro-3-deoxygalactonokinase [Herbaspirillum sp. LeCh32-8]|uniref:2-dehydro-3-deoxygalactonokinase n=1 Tax=Herbaspirillum sp. LeCh32-8 TaxID=2821356 RepID=UPI001AE29019|nr:2-dehydro-3-deoxygalactonokinase [Herbaspirillum sp. LeCh32-8]MBP0600457.1 2-dehydro-3-deoxygalactonokinase [Herbaspirillum sp. LeCh32-8]
MTGATKLIALDWGTSSLRAYRLGDDGAVLDRRALPWGIMNLPVVEASAVGSKAGFEQAFEEACGDWLAAAPGTPVVAAGMVGSAQGWREAAYLEVPLQVADIGAGLTAVPTRNGAVLHIVPGLIERGELPNVMRGEETQVAGALQDGAAGELLIGLPGTHSKWVRIMGEHGGERFTHFDTFMTGEAYAALSGHTILGRTMERGAGAGFDAAAFERGARVALGAAGINGVLSTIFSTRTLGLTGALNGAAQADYLSGLLIGHEIAALRAARMGDGLTANPRVVLIGDGKLCERYRQALALYGYTDVSVAAQATERGLWKLAMQAGLIR